MGCYLWIKGGLWKYRFEWGKIYKLLGLLVSKWVDLMNVGIWVGYAITFAVPKEKLLLIV